MRIGKILALCLFASAMTATLEAQALFLGDYNADATARFSGGTALPQAFSSGNLTLYAIPANWVRFRVQGSFAITDIAQFVDPDSSKDQTGTIDFTGLAIEFPAIAGLPQSFSLFSGYYDDLLSDSLLRSDLKQAMDKPEFQSLPAGNMLSRDTDIEGIGVAIQAHPINAGLALGLYSYVNAINSTPLEITAAPRVAAYNADFFQGNAFASVTLNTNTSGVKIRGGFSTLLSAPSGQELFMQAGVNQFTAEAGAAERIGKKIYVLFEPRLHFGLTDLSIAFFSSPVESAANPLLNGDYLGSNLLVGFGNVKTNGMRAGISVLGMIDPENPGTVTPFTFSITPFYNFRISENIIALAAKMNPLALTNPGSAIEARISLKAVY